MLLLLGRTWRLAFAVCVVLTLGACAEKPAEEHPTIIWNSDRAAPASTQPAGTGAGPQPSAAPEAAPPATSGAPNESPDGCREFTDTVIIAGKRQQAHGRVCPQPDGTWRIEPSAQPPELPGPPPRV